MIAKIEIAIFSTFFRGLGSCGNQTVIKSQFSCLAYLMTTLFKYVWQLGGEEKRRDKGGFFFFFRLENGKTQKLHLYSPDEGNTRGICQNKKIAIRWDVIKIMSAPGEEGEINPLYLLSLFED